MSMSSAAWKLLDRGQRLETEGKPEEAAGLFKQAVEQLSGSVGARVQWATFLLNQNRPEEAAGVLREAADLDPKNPAPQLFLALAHSDRGEPAAAAEACSVLEKNCPGNQVLPTLRTILQLRHDPIQKLRLPEDLCVSAPFLKTLLLETERNLLPLESTLLNRNPAPSEEEIDEFEAPPAPSFGQQLRSLGDSFRGWACRRKGRRVVESVFYSRSAAGKQAALGKACAYLRLARKLEPTGFRSDYYLGEAMLLWSTPNPGEAFAASRVARARESFIRSRQRDGANPYVHYYLGRCSQLLGEVLAAEDYYKRALARFEKLPEAHYGLGQCYLLLGREAEAKRYLYQAVSSDLTLARERLRDLQRVFELDSSLLGRELPSLPPEESLTKGQHGIESSAAKLAPEAEEPTERESPLDSQPDQSEPEES